MRIEHDATHLLLCVTMLERKTKHNLFEQDVRSIVVLFQGFVRISDDTIVEAIQFAAQRKAQHLSTKIGEKLLFSMEQHMLELCGRRKLLSARQFARGIDGLTADLVSPTPDRVKVL